MTTLFDNIVVAYCNVLQVHHSCMYSMIYVSGRIIFTYFKLEWTTRLDTISRTLFVRDSLTHSLRAEDVHVTSNVELRNNVRLLLNVDLRNYVISCQIVI